MSFVNDISRYTQWLWLCVTGPTSMTSITSVEMVVAVTASNAQNMCG